MKTIREANFGGKTVFLRVDFNVPIRNGEVLDDNRIKKTIPTIKYLLGQKAKIIIATHVGQPKGQVVSSLSTIPIAKKLAQDLDREIIATDHVIHPIVTQKVAKLKSGDILFIGNLRFHQEEEDNSDIFAAELAKYADIYVNDAFGASHRAHASIDAITKHLPSYAGILLESEITTLNLLLSSPRQPFCLVLGGAKVKDKLPMIDNMAPKVEKILIGGAVANTFLAASGENISESLYEKDMFEKCKEYLEKFGDKILLPIDFIKEKISEDSFKIMDIGEQTANEYATEIGKAASLFWNGNMGFSEDEKYAKGTLKTAYAIVNNSGVTVVAGGDTAGFLSTHGVEKGINFISTGGGATLAYLSGKGLPGIEALKTSQAVQTNS